MKIDGVDLESLGFVPLKGQIDPVSPPTRDRTLEIPNRHGLYDFGAYMEPKLFNIPLGYYPSSRDELQSKLRELKKILFDHYGRPKTVKLEFDYETEKWYNVRFSGSIPIERTLEYGEFILPLTAYDPWCYALADAYDPSSVPNYDEGTEYDSEVEYINQTHTPFNNIKQYVGIYNYSHYNTPFSFVIEGAVSNPKITNTTTGKSVSFDGLTLTPDERLYFDSEKMTVWKIKATADTYYWLTPNMIMKYPSEWEKLNVYHEMSGDFLELTSAGNTLLFEGDSPNASVNFNWLHRFM